MVRKKFLGLGDKLLDWFEGIDPFSLFLSLIFLRLLDTSTAFAVFYFRPDRFVRLEQYVLFKDFFVQGNWIPYLLLEIGLLLLFSMIVLSLDYSKRETEEFEWRHYLSFIFIGLALAFVWTAPIAAGTNVVTGMLLVSGRRALVGYVLFGVPIALSVTYKILNIRDSRFLILLTLGLSFLILFIF